MIDTDFRAANGIAMKSRLGNFLNGIMEQAIHEAPSVFGSVDSMVTFVDRMGEVTAKEIIKWQPKQAVVIQMPKRSRRRAKR